MKDNISKSLNDLKALTTNVPYWALVLLFVAMFFDMEKNSQAFLVMYFVLLITFNESLWKSTPAWAVKFMQIVATIASLFFMVATPLRQLLE